MGMGACLALIQREWERKGSRATVKFAVASITFLQQVELFQGRIFSFFKMWAIWWFNCGQEICQDLRRPKVKILEQKLLVTSLFTISHTHIHWTHTCTLAGFENPSLSTFSTFFSCFSDVSSSVWISYDVLMCAYICERACTQARVCVCGGGCTCICWFILWVNDSML